MKRLLLLLTLVCWGLSAQTNVTVTGNRVFGTGAPGTSTPLPVGLAVGVQYTDVSTGNAYVCAAAASTGTSCTTWTAQSGGSPAGNTGDLQCKNGSAFNFCGSAAGEYTSNGSGLVTHSETGVFTSSAMNEYNVYSINGGSTTLFQNAHPTFTATEGVASAIVNPSGATSGNWANAFGAYVSNSSALGLNAPGVGYSSTIKCMVSGSQCWGANHVVYDASSLTGTTPVLYGEEIDVEANNTGDTGAGSLYVSYTTASLSGNLPAIHITTNSGAQPWTFGVWCDYASVATSCFDLYPLATGNSQHSSAATFFSTNSSGGNPDGRIQESDLGVFGTYSSPAQFAPNCSSAASCTTPALSPSTIAQVCSSSLEGTLVPIKNSSTATWGATIALTGSNHVLAYCDGTNLTVAAQ